jgi:hypothetical protein
MIERLGPRRSIADLAALDHDGASSIDRGWIGANSVILLPA